VVVVLIVVNIIVIVVVIIIIIIIISLTNSCIAWYKSYYFMHLITMVKVSACMAYCHNILSPKKFIIIIIIIIIIILIIMLIITFMQGIYNYIPEKIHVSWVYSVAAVLYLQFVLLFHP